MPGPWARHSGGGCCPLLAPVHFPPAPPLQASPVHPEAASWGQGFRIRGRDPGAVHPGARGSPAPAIDKFLFSEYLARPILGQLGNPRTHLCCPGGQQSKGERGFQQRRGNWALLPAVPWEPCLPREARGPGSAPRSPARHAPCVMRGPSVARSSDFSTAQHPGLCVKFTSFPPWTLRSTFLNK